MTKQAKKENKPSIPKILDARIKLLQKRLRHDEMDGLIVSNANDILYLTGFVGEDSWLWVPASGAGTTVVSDDRFKQHIPEEAPHLRVVMRDKNSGKAETLAQATARFLSRLKLERIGVQVAYLRVLERKAIVKAFSAKLIKDYDDKLLQQRSIKDAQEIKCIQEAIRIQELAFIEMRDHIKPGITEIELAGFLVYRMKCLGADDSGFKPIVAFDGHASHSHAIPDRRKLKKNSSILIDWGAKYNNYISDMTRVLNMGKPKKHLAEIHKVVEEALHIGIDTVAPGVTVREVDNAARNCLKKHGYKLDHGLGHGIGLFIHELPSIGQHDTPLEPGQVITIEPGIYLGEKGGVRLEDDILVTPTGSKNLSSLPTDLEWSIL
ncbi:MAG: M24 family metallopeptidase [Phycisphaeraceae bacterium]